MLRRQPPEIQLALKLASVALLCLVLGGIGSDEVRGRFLAWHG